MKRWTVFFSQHAEADIREIFEYIAITLSVSRIALEQIRRIINCVEKLDSMPERYPVYDKKPWNERGLRRMNVDNFSVFYIPDETVYTVTIIRIIYSGRNIDEILDGDDENCHKTNMTLIYKESIL